MPCRDHHLTDQDLLLALDRELPPRQRAAVTAHLAQCAQCSDRRAQIDRAAASFQAFHHGQDRDAVETAHGAAAREQLRSRLNEIAASGSGTRLEWFASLLTPAPRRVAIAAAVVAVVVLIRVVAHPSQPLQPLRAGLQVERDALPVAALTPGATWNLTLRELCAGGTHEQLQISSDVRQRVLGDYGMNDVSTDEYELDFLITPELGGAPDSRNLWPQRYTSRIWNAHVKDQLERLLPRLVCSGDVRLETAQRDIAVDWIAAYRKYFRTDVPIQTHTSVFTEDDRDPDFDHLSYPVWRGANAPTLQLISFAVGQ